MKQLFYIVALIVYSHQSFACASIKDGAGYSLEDLIDKSEVIVLVRLEKKTTNEFGDAVNLLKVTETIQGNPKSHYEFITLDDKHESATYLDHNDAGFWFNDIGRSPWYCCICGPDHTFSKDYTYLYFPNLLGAMKSAEIVKTREDRWLTFVMRRVAENANDS